MQDQLHSNRKSHYDISQDFWKLAINRTPIQIVRYLAVATKNFFTLIRDSNIIQNSLVWINPETKTIQFTPIQVAAEFGNLELIKHV